MAATEYCKADLPALFSVPKVVTVLHIEMDGKRNYGGDWHDFPELFFVEAGAQRLLVDGKLFELGAGQAILYAPNSYHIGSGQKTEAVVDIVSFETDFAGLPSLCNRVLTLSDGQRRQLSRIISQGLALLERPHGRNLPGMVAREGTDPMELMKFKSRLELLLLELYTDNKREKPTRSASNQVNFREEQWDTVTAYLRSQLHRTLSQDEIAAHCSISVSKLKKLCHEQLGCGPIAYFLALKIGEAKRLIHDSSLNFTQISERLGFSSIHYFSKLFKEKTGLTPSEYAKRIYRD